MSDDFNCTQCQYFDGSYYCPGVKGAPCLPDLPEEKPSRLTLSKPFVCRKPVAEFVSAMENKLKGADHKPHWSTCSVDYLFGRLLDEVEELTEAFDTGQSPEEIRDECADVANFAMMIADNIMKKKDSKV
jgi:NTP pyrophosphatase (non-canonical NTP hydrolase)